MLTTNQDVVGKFAVIALPGKKSIKYFVGQILSEEDDADGYNVKFLRHTAKKFYFPTVDDFSHVARNEIVKILPEPKNSSSSRELYFFEYDFTKYNITF